MNEKSNSGNFYLKIIVLTLFTVLLFVLAYFFFLIPDYRKSLLRDKEEMLTELTRTAMSILVRYDSLSSNNYISKAEAQKEALEEIRSLRYGPERKDYFWITDTVPIMLMHPYRPELNGTDVSGFEDLKGKKLFSDFVSIVKENDQGFDDYYWQWKDDPGSIQLKRSFIKIYKPWGWILGTGIYIQETHDQIRGMTTNFIWISLGIVFLGTLLMLITIYQSILVEKKRVQAVRDLVESEKRLSGLNKMKDRLFSVIAHDLRTPFNTILGFTELLHNNPDRLSEKQRAEITMHMNQQIKGTLDMLENLLSWAKAQTGQVLVHPMKFFLPEFIMDTVNEIIITAGSKEINILTETGNAGSIYTDPDLLKTVLRNLLSNAIKFSEKGGEIKVVAEHHKGYNAFKVIDKGAGMEKEYAAMLFNQGKIESHKGTANEKGSGLGLVICQEFVEKLGGTIWVESEPGKGSIFKFTIPDPAET